MRLVRDRSQEVAEWTALNIPHVDMFGPCVAIGVQDETDFLAGIVFHDWQPAHKTMQVSMAAITPRWARRRVILDILHYPFEEVGVEKLWAAMPSKNERAIRLNLGMGFTREAILARHFGKDHALITRMFRKDYARLKEKWNGQVKLRTAA